MVTKIFNIATPLAVFFLALYLHFGEKLFYTKSLIFKDSLYENEKIEIDLPKNWAIVSEDDKAIKLVGFPNDMPFVSLPIWIFKEGIIFADEYKQCKTGYSYLSSNITDKGGKVFVCILDKDNTKKPYFTYYSKEYNLSISTKNFYPNYTSVYNELIRKIKFKN